MKLNSGAERVLLSWGWLALMALRGAHLGAGKSIQRAALGREQRLNLSLNVKQASSAAPRPSWAESVTRSSGSQAQGASGEGQPQVIRWEVCLLEAINSMTTGFRLVWFAHRHDLNTQHCAWNSTHIWWTSEQKNIYDS